MFWLEVTDRKDIGADLNAPQKRDDGNEYYGYSLISEVRECDVVLHYHKDVSAMIAWSKASGSMWADNVVWGARGTVARLAGVRPYLRPGWRLGLEGTQPLVPEVTLEKMRDRQDAIQAIRNQLEEQHGRSLYFPFEMSSRRDLRPTQAYLTKFPSALLSLFPVLSALTIRDRKVRIISDWSAQHFVPGASLGIPYRPADEDRALSDLDPFRIDPALVERANRGHARTQNALAAYLLTKGWEPRSPTPLEPNYDIAWKRDGRTYVAEVKSLTDENEEKQLRLGLGQVLRYWDLLGGSQAQVVAVLAVEREPAEDGWLQLCEHLGVILTWPDVFSCIMP